MSNIIVNLENKIEDDFVVFFGENLEKKLENLGYDITLPSSTDWGYVFRIKFKRNKFDVVLKSDFNSNKSITISIFSTLNLFQKLIGKNDNNEIILLTEIINQNI
jgi:hypothetical protein